MKKIFAIVIAIAMVLSLVTVPAIAETRTATPSTAAMAMPRESTRDAANLDEALNVPGGNLVFTSEGQYPWVVEGDAAKSSNEGVASSTSEVSTTVTAAAGDIVQFDFKAWGEGSYTYWDHCDFAIDGSVMFTQGAYDNVDWETYATELSAGSHTLTWSYTKDGSVNPNGDYFMVDNVYVGQPVMAETINVDPVTVPAGRRASVSYEVLPAAAYDKSVTFSTADAAIATVNAAGVVTGVAEGTTTITVTSAAVPTVSGTATITVTEALPAVNLEGYATYDLASSGLEGNWIGFADYDPSTVSVLAPLGQQAWAGAFAGGNVYGYIYDSNGADHKFYIMDANTYSVSYPGNNANAVGGVIGMAYNHANQTMYGLSTNREIVTVDLATGVPTVVAPIDNENVLLLLAIDQEGNAYTMTTAGDLVALDLTNGSTAVIGSTGLSANYVQSMTYDFDTDMIYWAQIFDASSHGLYAVNPQTAAAESLGVIGSGGVEVVSMYIKNNLPIDDIEVPDVTVTFVDGLDNSVIGTQVVEAGTVLDESTFPTAPTHEGYEFTGWDYNGAAVWSDLTVKAKYRDPNATTATVVLSVPQDVWGDGSGYQMLIDADATAYGTIIPETGGLTSAGDAPAGTYDQFEYKIPVNADGSCTTQNIIVTGEIAIEIPAGTYDWCITNPTPGDRIWIASSNGNVPGRYDDFEFEGGNTYTFTVTFGGQNDQVNLEVEGGTTPVDPTPTPDDPTPTPVDPTPTPTPVDPGEGIIWDFEQDPEAQGFIFLDQDGDGNNWMWCYGAEYSEHNYHEGLGFMASESYINYVGALTPDNWMVTPEFNGTQLTFWAAGQDPSYAAEYLGVFVSTDGGSTWSNEIFGCTLTGSDTQYTVDLSAYAGQNIKAAIRHYNVTDMFRANVDYIEVLGGGDQPPVTGIIGDTNLDGEVTVADAILALRHIMGLDTLTGEALEQADANQDGNVTIEDCILILRAALGLIEL
ncbi:MAG: DUF2436 domain-containing protein [Clostridia bacterium]|nr:DUF2436 domain-containing protein [Clostridia bacterium]